MSINTTDLSTWHLGRLNVALDKQKRFAGVVRTWRQQIAFLAASGAIVKSEGDGFIDWNRTAFNRMDYKQQRDYEARLKARRYYYINNIQAPKIIFDAIETE